MRLVGDDGLNPGVDGAHTKRQERPDQVDHEHVGFLYTRHDKDFSFLYTRHDKNVSFLYTRHDKDFSFLYTQIKTQRLKRTLFNQD